jgi:hypothetical protein
MKAAESAGLTDVLDGPELEGPELFYARFNTAFARVYAFIDKRVKERATTELLTCEVLLRSLDALAASDEVTSTALLFENTKTVLREHAIRPAPRADS